MLLAADVAYQLARKPTELLGLVAAPRPKAPDATWAEYGALFDAHSTALVRPELLAALAQAESAGDPLARTYWRWQWSWNPLDFYAPASSAVGLLQITDGTFEQARRLCIHGHEVARDGPWSDPRTCWFNGLYFRTLPGDAIEMTAAMLHLAIERILAEQRVARASPDQVDRLAAVIHLCGPERGAAYARRGFRAVPGERCGDHDLAEYVGRVEGFARTFGRMRMRAER
ncbi:transglycosylase SLT domain-containing protein [Anaeromyxobacter oryzae]|uniref:Transglycosylase n=1 Tax=Anaeromyxobacter oryzae TaxID=2918170 RepID=A0ABM7X1Z4_9BACT|nr:transglycosylase SLT domain-containing protein [Anaeromyxobacter oryzae]BDG05816.1 transglycosylase [Anaeromyxobacter oryzae]